MQLPNTVVSDTIHMLLSGISLFYSLWFITILAPITWRNKKIISNMFIVWCVLAGMRIALLFDPKPIPFMFIPDPLNTILFICAGVIIFICMILTQRFQNRQFQKKANALSQIEDFLQISPREFEDMIVELYERAGHKPKRTGATGDHGVDIVVDAKNGEKWVVQCKRWRGSVGEPVVRDFYGVVQHEKADKGIIFTTGRFTASAQQWAKGKPIALYDGNKLVEIWSRSKAHQQNADKPPTVSTQS